MFLSQVIDVAIEGTSKPHLFEKKDDRKILNDTDDPDNDEAAEGDRRHRVLLKHTGKV
jgi:hypothetical protein